MRIRGSDKKNEEIRLQMTPMIDIVFQLLVFFIMTYKVTALEGDYNIIMPSSSDQQTMDVDTLEDVLEVQLVAGENRWLESIQVRYGMEERTWQSPAVDDPAQRQPAFNSLHNFVLGIVGSGNADPATASDIEAELEIDYDLRYEDTVAAIEAISGYKREDGQIVKLIEKIKFRNNN